MTTRNILQKPFFQIFGDKSHHGEDLDDGKGIQWFDCFRVIVFCQFCREIQCPFTKEPEICQLISGCLIADVFLFRFDDSCRCFVLWSPLRPRTKMRQSDRGLTRSPKEKPSQPPAKR